MARMDTEVEGMTRTKVVGTGVQCHSRYLQVEHFEVLGGMDTEAEEMNHMAPEAPEVERMGHMAPEVVRRGSIKLGESAKKRHWCDDVSERHHRGLLVTLRESDP
jgi:hypothetical protein